MIVIIYIILKNYPINFIIHLFVLINLKSKKVNLIFFHYFLLIKIVYYNGTKTKIDITCFEKVIIYIIINDYKLLYFITNNINLLFNLKF